LPHVPVRNFFTQLRTQIDIEDNSEVKCTGTDEVQQDPANQAGRPPPIILTSTNNLLQLQKKIRGLVKGNFDFRNTRQGTRVVIGKLRTFQP
jgi:hypothetical protein